MHPDFGFNNYLIFDHDTDKKKYQQFSLGWRLIQDFASPFPKFERLKNYVNCINEAKFIQESQRFQHQSELEAANTANNAARGGASGAVAGRRTSTLQKLSMNMSATEQFEVLQRMKAEMAQSKTNKSKSKTRNQGMS